MNPLARTAPSKVWNAHLVVAALAFLLSGSPAFADDYADVNRLIKAGQNAEALNKAEQYLTAKPRDPQMRFLKGVILAEAGKTSDAVAVFVKLTEEFPELPEPYNNLAVLYASQSQFDKARVALEMAIRTNPSYATAHENLGDVYAKLASQAYSKALQLDSSNAAVPPKLALIRNLFAPDGRANRAASPAAAPASPTNAAAVAPAPAPAAATAATAAATAQPKPTAAADPLEKEISSAVDAWAKAWASKDMDAYLGAYAQKFKPEGQKDRKAWEQERKLRITSKGSITVDVSDLEVKSDENQVTAVFRQRYKSGSLVSNSRKTLVFAKEGNRWAIVREFSGS